MAGKIIEAGGLTLDGLEKILTAAGDTIRKIALGTANLTDMDWSRGGVYFESGTSDVVLPSDVGPQQALQYNARKTSGPTATGVVGAIGYKMSDGNTLGIMFSVPYDYNLYSNWWNVKVYEGNKSVDYDMYSDLYDNATTKGDDSWHDYDIGHGYKVEGFMSSSGTPKFMARIKKE